MQQRLADPAVLEMYERFIPIEWLKADPNEINKDGHKRFEKFRGDADERLDQLQAGCKDRDECKRLAWRVVRDCMLTDGDWLHTGTGLGAETFFYLVSRLEDGIRGNPAAPLFRCGADEDRASDRGNRCILALEHMLSMVLYRVWTGASQAALQGVFGVDQTTASRNIRMITGMLGSTGMLPTAETIRGEIARAPKKRALEAIGGTLNMDWVHVEIEKPADKDSNDEAYSHKADATTCKFMAACIKAGLLVMSGPALGGRGSEIEYLRRWMPDMGHVTVSLTSPDTPEGERITVNLDGGPRGADKELLGANVKMPHRKPPGGELTEEQNRYNSRLAGRRAIIENNFADIKAHRILNNVFRGSVDDLEETFALVTGLVNFKRIMRGARGWRPNTHRDDAAPWLDDEDRHKRKPRKTFEISDDG